MKIWKLYFEVDKYDNLTLINKISSKEIQSFDGRKKIEGWDNPEVVRLEPEKKLPLSDAPGFYSHLPIFNQKAILVLTPFLRETAELLPLKNDEDKFYAVNIIKVLDCIDYEKSEYKLFKDGNKIMKFIKYAFIEQKLVGCHIFKIIDKPLDRLFVSDEFRNTVIKNNLTGFIFKPVWDSKE